MADAGANALLEIRSNGAIAPLATFADRLVDAPPFLGLPPGTKIPIDTVPTSVALGPDGNFYVGQLTGLPFPVGAANIYRVPAAGGAPQVFATGFTHIVDLTFGPDGSLYVVEIAKNGLLAAFDGNDWTGALIRIAPDGTRTELVPGVLTAPGGVAVGSNGDLYVTNNSIYSDIGQVIRIRPQTPRFVGIVNSPCGRPHPPIAGARLPSAVVTSSPSSGTVTSPTPPASLPAFRRPVGVRLPQCGQAGDRGEQRFRVDRLRKVQLEPGVEGVLAILIARQRSQRRRRGLARRPLHRRAPCGPANSHPRPASRCRPASRRRAPALSSSRASAAELAVSTRMRSVARFAATASRFS